jgi:putative transposase
MMDLGDRVATVKFLLRDRDSRFTGVFNTVCAAEGIRILASPLGAPRANAICERMIGTLRRALLDRILIVNERHLRRILTDYLHHFNAARPHRALAQLAPAQTKTQPPHGINLAGYQVRRRPILDGLTSDYQHRGMIDTSTRKPADQAGLLAAGRTCGPHGPEPQRPSY